MRKYRLTAASLAQHINGNGRSKKNRRDHNALKTRRPHQEQCVDEAERTEEASFADAWRMRPVQMLVLPANHHVIGSRANIRNQNRIDCAAIEELIGARRHIRHDQEELRNAGAHENRYHRGIVFVRLGKRQREGPLARCLERRLGCNDDVAQHRADQRENNAKVYDGSANRTDCALENSRHGGRCELCHLLARHNAE